MTLNDLLLLLGELLSECSRTDDLSPDVPPILGLPPNSVTLNLQNKGVLVIFCDFGLQHTF